MSATRSGVHGPLPKWSADALRLMVNDLDLQVLALRAQGLQFSDIDRRMSQSASSTCSRLGRLRRRLRVLTTDEVIAVVRSAGILPDVENVRHE